MTCLHNTYFWYYVLLLLYVMRAAILTANGKSKRVNFTRKLELQLIEHYSYCNITANYTLVFTFLATTTIIINSNFECFNYDVLAELIKLQLNY